MARWGRAFPARPIYSHGPPIEEAPCVVNIVQSDINSTGGVVGTTGLTVTFSASTASGNVIVVCVTTFDFGQAGTIQTPTDNKGNTYLPIGSAQTISSNLDHHMFYVENCVGGASHQVTVTFNNAADIAFTVGIVELSGTPTSGALDQQSGATGTGTTPNSGSITTVSGAASIGSCAIDSTAVGDPQTGAGWTQLELVDGSGVSVALNVEGRIDFDGAATWTNSGSVPWTAKVASFAPDCAPEEASPPPPVVVEVPPRPRRTPVTISSHGPVPEEVVVTPPPPEIVRVPPRPRPTPVSIASHGPTPEQAIPSPAGTAVAGALAYGTATKIATSTAGRSVAGALARGVAVKVASPVGLCAAGALARGTAVKVAIPVGRSVAGALARGSATKIATTTAGRSVAGALARGISSKIASTSGFAYAGALAYGSTVEIPNPIGSSVAGASTQGTAAKTAIPSGRAVAGASTQGTATQPRQVSGVCAAGVSAYGVAVQGGDIVMDTQVLPLAQALRDCLCAWASVNPNPPQNCCFRVGTIAHDADLHTDLCCEGIAYVSIGDIWPSNVFPDEDSTQASKVCSPPSWGVELRAGIVRCAPTGTDTEMPSCDDWALAHIQAANDAQALRKTACCIRAWVNTNAPGMSVVIQRQVQTDPSGGCMERYFTVALQIPNCDC